ncbi:MAG: hypothetical protein K2X93_22040 [Candidatus Obscuribacterales bacterium]|nr:hypothetical protein [Candidatus Obscuribacterales bacterium]
MKKDLLSLIFAITLATGATAAHGQQQDTGASGVIDGSDVYQFLNSGPIIDGTRMEEASRKFDSAIKMPDRKHQCKTWQEVIDRDRKLQDAGVGAVYPGDGTSFGAPGTQNATRQGGSAYGGAYNPPRQKEKGPGWFTRAAEWVGFPISDEPLPGDVDASLAGDLPAGPDPRVYVHEMKHAPGEPGAQGQQQVNSVVAPRPSYTEQQPPTVIVDEGNPPTR